MNSIDSSIDENFRSRDKRTPSSKRVKQKKKKVNRSKQRNKIAKEMKNKNRGESGFLNIKTAISPSPQPPIVQPIIDTKSNDDSEEDEGRVFITAQLNSAISSIERSMERFRKHRYNPDQREAEMGWVLFRSSLQK